MCIAFQDTCDLNLQRIVKYKYNYDSSGIIQDGRLQSDS